MKRLVAAALAVSLMAGSIVTAEARDHDRDRGKHGHSAKSHRPDRHWDDRRDSRRAYEHGYRHGRYDAGRYHRPTGYRHHAWHRGARLPAAYYAPRYVVHNYGAYRLHRPPHGHHWVRVNNDVVLAAIASGIVVAVVNDLFW